MRHHTTGAQAGAVPTHKIAALALAALLLAGCGSLPPAANVAQVSAGTVPSGWQTPLPHAGQPAELARWWQQFNDPVLDHLIAAAEARSATLAEAASNIEQARAARTAAGAALLPNLGANATATRGRSDPSLPVGNSFGVGLQASWEVDLFGAGRAGSEAAQARLLGAQAGWHGARVSVAAEVASTYLSLRACEATRVQTEADANSRAQTARLTELAARAGFQAPADAALAAAGAAQSRATAALQRSQCDRQVKALVALSGLAEQALRSDLAAGLARLPQPAEIDVPAVPAQALAQRPDLYTSARALLAASADTDQARAQRWPSISLAGSVGRSRIEASGLTVSGTTWSLGPLSVSLPLFDGGVRQANVTAAQARYDAALSRYTSDLRGAVREVEEALLALQSTASRSDDARIAAEGFESALRATEARQRGGLASLFELEDSRRNALQARSALIDLQRERVAAWISLYRALGGGWSEPADVPATAAANSAADGASGGAASGAPRGALLGASAGTAPGATVSSAPTSTSAAAALPTRLASVAPTAP